MFNNLVDFGYIRTAKQAVGFYLAYLLFNFLIGGILGYFFAQDFNSGVKIGAYSATITTLIIGILILYNRHRYKNFLYIILVLLSLILTPFGGSLLGLIPIAYLTTRK